MSRMGWLGWGIASGLASFLAGIVVATWGLTDPDGNRR